MRVARLAGWKALLLGAGLTVAGGLVLGAVVILSGVYNVAASIPHFAITDRLIKLALHRSVATHSMGIEPPDLADEDLVRLGVGHYQLGCAPCHADPTSEANPVVGHMYPAPPQLSQAVGKWETAELFWIVKHGFKFTGMPAWPGEHRDDEVWAVVAFLQRLPQMSAADYRALAGESAAPGEKEAADFDFTDAPGAGVRSCARCHGDENSLPSSDRVPALQGQNQAYLRRAMDEYRADRRQSGVMEPIAAALGPGELDRLARYYSEAPRPPSDMSDGDAPQSAARGEEIATNGIPGEGIPPCLACHSGKASDQFPLLNGLSAEYLSAQLKLWQHGHRNQTAYGAIMATVARRLSPEQINDVAAYFASLPGPAAALSEAQAAEGDAP